MKKILLSKLHLVEGAVIPKSFEDYIEHYTEQALRGHLEKELSLDDSVALHAKWPETFENEIRTSLQELMNRYNRCLNDLDPHIAYRLKKESG